CAVFTESPYDDVQQARVADLFDVCFTNERTSVATLRAANPNTHYLPAAYDPLAHGNHPAYAESHDVVFVGTGFESRVELLAAVDWTGIDLGLYGPWPEFPAGHPLAPFVLRGLVGNRRAGALYRSARIGLNLYREPPRCDGVPMAGESPHPRAYELAADALCTISHYRAEVVERFDGGVATFRTAAQLGDRIRSHLAHPNGLGEHLRACVRTDTYHHRAAQLVAHLNGT